MKYKLGADPELFLTKNGIITSAIGMLNGTKEKPQKISDKGHSVQIDNVLLEFNIPASNNSDDMYGDIQLVLNWFKNHFKAPYGIIIKSSANLSKEELKHPDALHFGCDPDYNVYLKDENIAPLACDVGSLRSAGGHLHVSYEDTSINSSLELIKLFDLFLGVKSLLYDKDKNRRKLYGKAGAFRFKSYPNHEEGFEYRVLSNFWIKSKENVEMIFNQVDKAFKAFETGFRIADDSELANKVISTINTNDVKTAINLIKQFKI